ncbi:MAG: methyltransferase domain-containing protein [Candidatus Aenigmatarchaeota archaeon]
MKSEKISKYWDEKWSKETTDKLKLHNFGICVKDLVLFTKKLVLNLPLQERSKILDIGGATGKILQFYFDNDLYKNFEFYIVDISKEALKIAEKRGYKTFCIDIENSGLPFLENEFSLVILQEVIEHLHNPEIVLREIFRVLKPKGFVVVTTPNVVSLHDRLRILLGYKPSCMLLDETHIKFFTHSDIETLLSKCKFKVIFSSTQGIYIPVRFLWFKKYIKIPFIHKIFKELGQNIIIIGQKFK